MPILLPGFVLLLLCQPLLAAPIPEDGWQHALSLNGNPRHPAEFTHFNTINPNAPKGGHVRFAISGTFDTLNPYTLKGTPPSKASWVFRYGFTEHNEPLMVGVGYYAPAFDELDTAYGLIAEAVKLSKDRTRLEFRLNPGARFHDGQPITSKDVIFSYRTFLADPQKQYTALLNQVEEVLAPSEHHVIFKLKPDSSFSLPLILCQLAVLPEHYWKNRNFYKSTMEPPLLSGPYKIVKAEVGRKVEYQRVENYWGKDLPVNRGMHNFERVTLSFFRDSNIAFEAFKAGKADAFFESLAKNWAAGYDFEAVKDGKILREEILHEMPHGRRFYVFNLRKPQFQDARVREALGLMFDWEWTSRVIFHNAYIRSTSYFPQHNTVTTAPPTGEELALLTPHKKQLPGPLFKQPFKLSQSSGNGDMSSQKRQALTLLKSAGWHPKNGQLVHKDSKFPLKLKFIHHSAYMERFVLPFARNLKTIGVEMEFQHVDISQYYRRLQQHDFDITQYIYPLHHLPSEELLNYFHSSRRDTADSRSLMGLNDPVVDELLEKIMACRDMDKLQILVQALDRVLLWQHYAIPNWHGNVHRLAWWNHLQHSSPWPRYGFRLNTWWTNKK